MKRRSFIKGVAAGVSSVAMLRVPAFGEKSGQKSSSRPSIAPDASTPGASLPTILNEYTAFLPGEAEALAAKITVHRIEVEYQEVEASASGENKKIKVGDSVGGWRLLAILPWHNGTPTAVFEKHVTHQGAIAFVTAERELARIPKQIGDLSKIKPRPVHESSKIKFERPGTIATGPDTLGQYVLNSDQDPSFENLAGLGKEYTGWTLVSDDGVGALKSIWLEADGKSRQVSDDPQASWAPDTNGRLFEPGRLLALPYFYVLKPGYSKRTMLGGFLPAADIGVWNPDHGVGYEVMMVLSDNAEQKPIARVRATLHPTQTGAFRGGDRVTEPIVRDGVMDRYWNGSANDFYTAVLNLWLRWTAFFDTRMKVDIPDPWLLQSAKAGIVLSRCSYRGLEPTYQIGEGAYTKIPERSHALFPVAHYEFVWAQQLWNLAEEVEPYFEHYLDNYILPDGNFLYNTQDQVEAPLNAGVFLENSARAYDYTRNFEALKRRLPVLRRMIDFVVKRYQYSKQTFPPDDPRHGLIWGSPEADNGDPQNDFPESHPYYYQNASWTWRGLREQARCLSRAGNDYHDDALRSESRQLETLAAQMRTDIERSLQKTLEARNPAMKEAGITPFTPFDTTRKPTELTSYENHRYMMDWWTSDWGDPALDEGHFKHRLIAGEQLMGLNTDGHYPRTSNFMSHGTLAGRIRQEDYRPFLLTLYGLCCYTMDCGNRYSPEDALLPGNYPGEGSPYGWSAVVNSELQPAMGLRWLLCYEEHDRDVVHLQKAAPQHWFRVGEKIRVWQCPTRFGLVSWTTESVAGGAGRPQWQVKIQFLAPFNADLVIHIHPPDRHPLRSTSTGQLHKDRVILPGSLLAGKTVVEIEIA